MPECAQCHFTSFQFTADKGCAYRRHICVQELNKAVFGEVVNKMAAYQDIAGLNPEPGIKDVGLFKKQFRVTSIFATGILEAVEVAIDAGYGKGGLQCPQ